MRGPLMKVDRTSEFVRTLEHLMRTAPGGPHTVTGLSDATGIPRSTIQRHLRGGQPMRKSLEAYAKALDVPAEQLIALAGFSVPNYERVPDVARALAIELAQLDPEDLDAIRAVLTALRRRRPAPAADHPIPLRR